MAPATKNPPPGKRPPPSLAWERTRLAWSRTVIAFAAVGGALLKTDIAAGAIVVAMSVLLWVLFRVIPDQPGGAASPARLRLVAVTVAGVAVVALAVAFLGRGA
jgi:uncharacterized membrane protein YidH (DUF202 family)